jgi:hypothetical protein
MTLQRPAAQPWHLHPPTGQEGVIWLLAALGLAAVLVTESICVGMSALMGQHTVAIAQAQLQASCAAESGLAVASALAARGRLAGRLSGRCGEGAYEVTVEPMATGWLVTSTGWATGPMGLQAERTLQAEIRPSGQVGGFRYLRPLAPTRAGKA